MKNSLQGHVDGFSFVFTGWTAYLDSCIRFYTTSSGYTYSQAGTYCQSQGGVLLSAESTNKFSFVQSYYSSAYNTQHYHSAAWVTNCILSG